MSKHEHIINLVLGDWSHDGHSMTETITISSNLDIKDVEKAYKKGVKKLGLDFQNSVAAEYEDSSVTKDDWKILARAGLTLEEVFKDDEYSGLEEAQNAVADDDEVCFGIYEDQYVRMWLFVVKLGNPSFEYEIEEDESPNINIGGYGLFGS